MAKEIIEDETFEGETVYVDSARFRNCTFKDCELVYRGEEWDLQGCRFQNFILNFEGAADRTLVFLQWLYVHDGTTRDIVETIFEQIRATRPAQGRPT